MPGPGAARQRRAGPEPVRAGAGEDAPFVEAAWLYYHEGLNQNEIADRMRISRASVVNYLGEARTRGWVRVYLDSDVFLGHRLSAELCAAYGLAEALVVPDDAGDPGSELARVTRAAADWLPRLIAPGDRLGVSWGETIHQMAAEMMPTPVEDLTVVQLLGSRAAARGFAAEACTTMIAQKLGGLCVNLHVPVLLSSKAVRDILAAEPAIAAQLAALATCNKTVLACGTCDPEAHIVQAGLIGAESVAGFLARGAVGVICGRLIDADGAPVRAAMEERMIGVSLDEMRGKEMSLLVAAGPGRARPARAAIRGGYVTHLATSARIARELLEMAG